jgi:hypothetical protein
LPGNRVRKYTALNETEDSMLQYTLDDQLFDEITAKLELQGTAFAS